MGVVITVALLSALCAGATAWAARAERECTRLQNERMSLLAREDLLVLRAAAKTPAQATALIAAQSAPVPVASDERYLYDDTGLQQERLPWGDN